MKKLLMKFVRDERGLAAVEYAVVAGLLVATLIPVFGLIGGAAETRLRALLTALTG